MITDAVSTQPWPGEAVVEVAIVNWVKEPDSLPGRFVLDEQEVAGIDTALRESTVPNADVPTLPANRGRAFQGVIPRGDGFVLPSEEGQQLRERSDADYRAVVLPYIGGKDITSTVRQEPSRFIVDFGVRPLEDAMRFPAALDIVRARVKPLRDLDPVYADCWWRLWRPRPELAAATARLERFVAGTRVAKRILFVWCEIGVQATRRMSSPSTATTRSAS